MPKLYPIQALRFATETGDITSRIAPPYDVLDEGPKQALLDRDPNNIVAIDLPVTPPKTVGPDAAYAQAGQTMQQWIEQGVLQQDDAPAVYAYEQEYTVDGTTYKRRGLFAGVGVEEFNQPHGIFRHEMTIKAGTDDRMLLMEATSAQLSPIFGVFHDADAKITGAMGSYFDRTPDFHGTTENDNVIHRCWIVDDPAILQQVQDHFAQTEVYIADGHHRYTTALNYSKKHPDKAGAVACLFVLVAVEDPGMNVLPTHRVLCGLEGFDINKLRDLLTDWPMSMLPTTHGVDGLADLAAALPEAGHHAMGIYDPRTNQTYVLACDGDDPLGDLLPDKPEVWRKLDVAVLHELLIDRVLRPNHGGEGVTFKYTADLDEMHTLSEQNQDSRLGIVMQATKLEDVCAVSLANEVMPPKSTYFFPKLATGMVINPLD